MCGAKPKGSGLQNLRECIIQTKWKYDVAPEDKQVAWKEMILNFMERYFYLICFEPMHESTDRLDFKRALFLYVLLNLIKI